MRHAAGVAQHRDRACSKVANLQLTVGQGTATAHRELQAQGILWHCSCIQAGAPQAQTASASPRRELQGMRLFDAITYLAAAHGSIIRLDFVVDLMLPVAQVRAPEAPSQQLTGRARC